MPKGRSAPCAMRLCSTIPKIRYSERLNPKSYPTSHNPTNPRPTNPNRKPNPTLNLTLVTLTVTLT